jgi:hypothetical protein
VPGEGFCGLAAHPRRRGVPLLLGVVLGGGVALKAVVGRGKRGGGGGGWGLKNQV